MEVVDGTLQLRTPVCVRARMGTVVPPAGSASGCPLPEVFCTISAGGGRVLLMSRGQKVRRHSFLAACLLPATTVANETRLSQLWHDLIVTSTPPGNLINPQRALSK